ncbi:MAG TPA: hypothetical protein VE569_00110, partial [Acidimicrobiia bacterium]|nr:hypothetical protein [Acidimicrobiia bacterium]
RQDDQVVEHCEEEHREVHDLRVQSFLSSLLLTEEKGPSRAPFLLTSGAAIGSHRTPYPDS